MKPPRKQLTIGVIAAGIALFAGSAIVSGAGAGDDGTVLVPTVPVRILDTRLGSSSILTLRPGQDATVSFAQSVPAGTRAVDINVTTTDGTEPSFLAVYPTGMQRPITSAVNWNGPSSQANSIAVKVNNNYEIDIYNAFGNVDVVIDLMGFYIDAPSSGEPGTNGTDGVNGADGVDGLNGADGADGLDGDVGETGPAGVSDLTMVSASTTVSSTSPATIQDVVATCPAGKVAVGGGYQTSGHLNSSDVAVISSYPSGVDEWTASGTTIFFNGTNTYTLTAYVLCATSPSIP